MLHIERLFIMSQLYKRIDELCLREGLNMTEMCKRSGASRASLSDLKMGRKQNLSAETLSKIAQCFSVSVDSLLGAKETRTTQSLSEKDRSDIAKEADWMIENLESERDLIFDGVPLKPEARDSLRAAFRLGLEAARLKNKEIYTAKKHRK